MNTTDALQQIFKDNFVAYFRSHVAHVNIMGRNFASDHTLLQGIYESLQEEIDTIGELIRTLGDLMPFDFQEVLDDSNLDTGSIEGTSDELLALVKDDLEYLETEYRELIGIAEQDEQQQIANYAQDRVLAIAKQIWMLESTLN